MALKEPTPATQITRAMIEGISSKLYPQKVYTLTLKDLLATGLRRAKFSGWRFTGEVAGRDVGVHVDQGRRPASTEFTHGEDVTIVRDTLRNTVKSPEVRKHHYELRLLSIPGIGVQAVWLKAEDGSSDLIRPYLHCRLVRASRFQPVEKFLAKIRREAEEQFEFDDSPRR